MATDFESRLEEALKGHPGPAVEERLRAAALDALPAPERARPKMLALPAWIRRPGRPRRAGDRRRRTWVIALAALTATTGGALAARALLQGEERTAVLVDPQAAERLARNPALADAPWLQGPSGVAYIQQVVPRPSLVFPPGVTYPEALQRFYDAVSRHGTLPAGARLGPPLPAGKIVALPADSRHGVAIDLRAPFGYRPDTGVINSPGYDPTFGGLGAARLPAPGRGTPLPVGLRVMPPIIGRPIPPGAGGCMYLDPLTPTPPCPLPPAPPAGGAAPAGGAPAYRPGATVVVEVPGQIAVADLDRDGRPDLALPTAIPGGRTLTVILRRGAGALSRPERYRLPFGAAAIAAGDLVPGSGPDLAVAGPAAIAVLANRGDGTFDRPVRYPTGRHDPLANEVPGSLVMADLAGAGRPALLAWNRETGALWTFLHGRSGLRRIAAGRVAALPQIHPVVAGDEMAAGDLTGDGRADLALAAGTRLVVLAGDGRGHFRPRQALACDPDRIGFDAEAVRLADLNGDGRLDIVVVGAAVTVALGRGDGRFGPCRVVVRLAGTTPGGLAVADLNGDGIPDLLVTDEAAGVVRLYAGRGDGSFREAAAYPAGLAPNTLAALPAAGGEPPVVIVASNIASTVTALLPAGTAPEGA
ncbi:MAG: large repetitive protein, partial [Miltoncostaeaceae bacterium]|nr:large repetitive protein [Miltoncostaeaceae bacterium]